MIGIVIPAHDEEEHIAACVRSARLAGAHPDLLGEPVQVLVVLDSCSDATGRLAAEFGAATLEVNARNVGTARALGAEALLAQGARWLAFTDADTRVSGSWLVDQLALQVDAVCGTVDVDDWSPHGAHEDLIRWHFGETYTDADGHSHIHGANLGVAADAYRRVGGFSALACSEDVALVEALRAGGARIAWSARPRVVTSARKNARASGGFADALINAVAQRLAEGALPAQ
ncbi:MAG: glycosyltransferase [Gammaproteobacteria bacterium]|nr:glycosyltransferase [Gammaproteobacteria bacterium]MBU1442963.1 glycosyltransferase [Gammaproteobacteria bacterium]MBU2288369.1 glycosyltransferase [Gammaproteobacteria bacterium]